MTTSNRIQFVGHSCFWVTLDGHHFFIDANFSQKLVGIARRHAPLGIDVKKIPQPTALLVTHAHYDHLDLFSYKYFSQNIPLIVPPGLGSLISRFLHNPITELDTDGEFMAGPVKIIAVKSRHVGWRVSGLRYTHCNGYILAGSTGTVYHPGDTAYGSHFEEIGRRFKIDVACLPIGAWRPRAIMRRQHLSPEEALQAFQDLKAKTMIPMHWGSFRLGRDAVNEPADEISRLLSGTDLGQSVRVLKPGEAVEMT